MNGSMGVNVGWVIHIAEYSSSSNYLKPDYPKSNYFLREINNHEVHVAGEITYSSFIVIYFSASMTENQCSFESTDYSTSQSSGQVTGIITPAVHLYLVIDLNYEYLVASRIARYYDFLYFVRWICSYNRFYVS